jgi:hypothetical protein
MKSIVTKYTDICIFCGAPAECEHHLLFGQGIRPLAEADGIKVPSCNRCHNLANKAIDRIHENPMAELLSKMLGQAIWEAHYGTREEFRKRYGQSYM